jgi:hypothetical protein
MGWRKGGWAHASTHGVEVTPEVVRGLVRRLGLDIGCGPRCDHLGVVSHRGVVMHNMHNHAS